MSTPNVTVNVPRQRGGLLRSAFVAVLLVGAGVYLANHFPSLNPFATKTVDRSPAPVLKAVQRVSEFHAARAQLQQVVDVERDVNNVPDFIAGSRQTMVVQGSVDAVVDLGGVGQDAVRVSKDGRVATITVPSPTLAEPRLDLDNSRVVASDRGIVNRVGDAIGSEPSDRALLLRAEDKLADGRASRPRRPADRAGQHPRDADPPRRRRSATTASTSASPRPRSDRLRGALSSLIGCHGRLTRHGGIEPGRLGEVMVAVDGGVQAFLARDADGGRIPPMTEVAVVDRLGARTLLVTPLYPDPLEGALIVTTSLIILIAAGGRRRRPDRRCSSSSTACRRPTRR